MLGIEVAIYEGNGFWFSVYIEVSQRGQNWGEVAQKFSGCVCASSGSSCGLADLYKTTIEQLIKK